MFSDVCPAQTEDAMLLMAIATTSSYTCTKPTVQATPAVSFPLFAILFLL